MMLGGLAGGGFLGILLTARSAANGIPRPSYGRAVTMVGLMLGVTAVVILFSRAFWSRSFVLTTTLAWLGAGLAHRWVRRRRPWVEALVLVTAEKALVDDLLDAPHAEVITVLDPAGVVPERPLPMGVILGVDLRAVLSDDMARFVSSCSLAGYPLRSLVSVYEEHTGRLPIVHLFEGWELTVPLSGRGPYVRIKRVLDTLLVLAVSPLAVLLGVMIAIAVRIDSRGPAIFKQRRIGLEGGVFTLYKFRTMRTDADHEARFASKTDDRLTRVGRFLRLIRADELPQLWNVLRGEMSLVGPRPERPVFVEQFTPEYPTYMLRHSVKGGLTGWAQVNGWRGNTSLTSRLEHDLHYVQNWSFAFDVKILWRTLTGGFLNKNAY